MAKCYSFTATVSGSVIAETEEEAASLLGDLLIDAFPGDVFNAGGSPLAVDIVAPSIEAPSSIGEKFAAMVKALLPNA